MKHIKKIINKKGFLLGVTEQDDFYYLEDFSWDCGWYWGGGYVHIHPYNRVEYHTHTHFNSVFFEDAKGEYIGNIKKMFKSSTLNRQEWWRMLDLMRQFYTYRKCAETFKNGGHYTSWGRSEGEIDLEMYSKVNYHLAENVLPQVRKLFETKAVHYAGMMTIKR